MTIALIVVGSLLLAPFAAAIVVYAIPRPRHYHGGEIGKATVQPEWPLYVERADYNGMRQWSSGDPEPVVYPRPYRYFTGGTHG